MKIAVNAKWTAFLGFASTLALGCSLENAAPDESAESVSEELTSIVSTDFESNPLGSLGAPWTVTTDGPGSASRATIVNTTDHGKVLLLHGGKVAPSFLIASLGFSSSVSVISAEVDVNPAAGATFVWSLNGAGSSLGARRIRLERGTVANPSSTSLDAQTSPSGTTSCVPNLPSGAWSRIKLVVHTDVFPHQFDVLLNGAATACTGIATGLSAPFNRVTIMDASNDGWGGDVRFDNIAVTGP